MAVSVNSTSLMKKQKTNLYRRAESKRLKKRLDSKNRNKKSKRNTLSRLMVFFLRTRHKKKSRIAYYKTTLVMNHRRCNEVPKMTYRQRPKFASSL